VTVARARGLSDGRIATAYVGRNAALPLVTQFALSLASVIGGAAVIERLYSYNGLGAQLVTSVMQRDYSVMQGIFLILTVYAGFLYLTARGEEEKVTHAKETLQRGVIGLIIISAAYAIATFVIGALSTATKATTGT